MSGQGNQRVRKIASPSMKQGPIKATLTFGLVHSSPTRNSNDKKLSPSSSPVLWTSDGKNKLRYSPDCRLSPDILSQNSTGLKADGKSNRSSPVGLIKRTGSLDTLGPYLTGQWPKDPLNSASPVAGPVFCLDKATQTPEKWNEHEGHERRKRHSHKRSASVGNSDSRKEHHKSRWKKSEGIRINTPPSRTSPIPPFTQLTVHSNGSTLKQSRAIAIPVIHIPKPVTRMRGSVEGPSQEVERALRRISSVDEDNRPQHPIPDGHRAPIVEILAGVGTRSIDTQTPSGNKVERCNFSIGSGDSSPIAEAVDGSRPGSNSSVSSRDSLNMADEEREETEGSEGDEPAIKMRALAIDDYEEELDEHRGFDSESSDDKLVPSPKPNKSFSFVREPPDGCEKVKIIEESRSIPSVKEPLLCCPVAKPSAFRIPSVDSAFCPLYKPFMCQAASSSTMQANADTCQ